MPSIDLILGPSEIEGVGVFANRTFIKGASLPLFAPREQTLTLGNVSEDMKTYCVVDEDDQDLYHCPEDFHRMSIGWYVNHSEQPNAAHKNFHYFALRDIRAGEEVTINYKTLKEASPDPVVS